MMAKFPINFDFSRTHNNKNKSDNSFISIAIIVFVIGGVLKFSLPSIKDATGPWFDDIYNTLYAAANFIFWLGVIVGALIVFFAFINSKNSSGKNY